MRGLRQIKVVLQQFKNKHTLNVGTCLQACLSSLTPCFFIVKMEPENKNEECPLVRSSTAAYYGPKVTFYCLVIKVIMTGA